MSLSLLSQARRTVRDDDALGVFVACAHAMLDPQTPEAARRTLESRLLAQLPTLRALGVFELFGIRNPALRAMVLDDLADRGYPLEA
jgi:hypothetical protein